MDTKVIDSRIVEQWNAVRRRRECEKCWFRFTTFERIVLTDLLVEKKDWTIETYSKEKLKNSLVTAFAKRPVSPAEIDEIINQLEEKWAWKKKITTKQIWKDILQILKNIDPVAYVRFASVHQEFDSVEDFKKILDQFINC
jgi:transcriptional repressor NrdR